MDRHPRQQPALYSVAITGPFDLGGAGETPKPASHPCVRAIHGVAGSSCAKDIIRTLARRAYRRPVTDEDVKVPLAFFEDGRDEGTFEDGIELALREAPGGPGVSVPHRARIRPASRRVPSIASAMSNWRRGCRSSCGAAFQTTNCSRWPRAASCTSRRRWSSRSAGCWPTRALRRWSDNFADQWLYLRNLAAVSPDARMFTVFDDNLRRAFRQRDRAVLREHHGARTAACSTCYERTTRSSTNVWQSTTAFRTCTAPSSGG